jgi:truncated hemoglobin YjbI
VATHVDHLTALLAEEFGGPTRYSEEFGGSPAVVAVHRGRKITEEQRRRFVWLFMTAADKAGFASDARFRDAIASAIEFGSEAAMVNAHATATTCFIPSVKYRAGTGETGRRARPSIASSCVVDRSS